jgi:GDP/UDP-N,N'-diacetylbacillosamine 2-epimerase (hydrolysing)
MNRRVVYVTGTRADYGLMQKTLARIAATPGLELAILVTGMHLSDTFGATVTEIERDGFAILDRVAVDMDEDTGAAMARGIGTMTARFADILGRHAPDIVVLLGDRGEMLAAAIAALHLGICIVHIHGGERSGTVDEPVRHAISKLSHFHFVATQGSYDRLVKMGEHPNTVHVTGAPGLVGLRDGVRATRAELAARCGFDPDMPMALVLFHPVLGEEAQGGQTTEIILGALARKNVQILALMPNADAGNRAIRAVLSAQEGAGRFAVETHLERDLFVSWMAGADIMVGNSSAGIIEAATFGTPVINIGARQDMRERNANVIDVAADTDAIAQAIETALATGRSAPANIYGSGDADTAIATLLTQIPVGDRLGAKSNAY